MFHNNHVIYKVMSNAPLIGVILVVLFTIYNTYESICKVNSEMQHTGSEMLLKKLKHSNNNQINIVDSYDNLNTIDLRIDNVMLNYVYCRDTEHYTINSTHVISNGKFVGGDEMYVEALNNKTVVAVAKTTDLQNGVYSYKWIPLVTSGFTQVRITQQYTCGRGSLPPPMKLSWKTGGSTNKVSIHNLVGHVKYSLIVPSINSTDTIAVGDSIIRDLEGPHIPVKLIQCSLTQTTVQTEFIPSVKRWIEKYNTTKRLVLNSGVWPILETTPEQNLNSFTSHISAMRTLLNYVKKNHTGVQIIWQSMTAMHVHICNCGKNIQCLNRIKYMSSSRARLLYELQKKLVSVEFSDVIFLDLYDITYASAHRSKPRDGRHYNTEFNQMLWEQYFI